MKNDDFLAIDFYDLFPGSSLSRRSFLKLLGGGIVILFTFRDPLFLEAQRRGGRQLPDDFNAFLRIGEDGRVSCFTGKIEMGQGVHTSLAQMLADELQVSLDAVDMVMGDTDLCPWDMGTWGSMSTRFFGPPLRAAAAEARAVLLELASEHLKIDPSQLRAEAGVIFHRTNREKKVTYAGLAKGKKIARRLEGTAVQEKPSEFSIVGKPILRQDAEEKVTGRAKFAGDIREPGMLYARILRPPAHDAARIRVDTSGVKKIKGAQVISDEDMIAVLHEDPELAGSALRQIKAEFEIPTSDLDENTIFDHLLKVAPDGEIISEGGNLAKGEKASRSVVANTYLDGYVAHASIETHTALAKIEGNRMILWASTQNPFGVKDDVASALGLEAENVRVITPWVGGGFGGKANNRQTVEAARLARITGRPVQVAWTRAEEFFYDTFRPAAVVKINAGVGDSGNLSFWDYGVYFAGERGAQQFYDIPHHRTMSFGSGWRGGPGSHPFGTGAWRAPANNTNTFARESQIEILAAEAGLDPLEFRLKNLKDKRMIRVLKEVAKKFDWKPEKTPDGIGFGIACGIDAGTYVAHMAEVEVDKKTMQIRINRIVCAQDMGLSINPEGARIQMEGCITMGLGYALEEDIRFRGGEILDLNFDTYEIPKFSWIPKIETVLIDDRNAPPQGGGEPAIICMGAVIANAVHDAIGVRVLQLPITAQRIKQASEL